MTRDRTKISRTRRRRPRAVIAAAIAAALMLGAVPMASTPVQAIEQATGSNVSSTTAASMTFRGGMTASISLTQGTTQYGARGAQLLSTTPHSGYGATSSMFSPALNPATIPTVGIESYAGMCGGVNYTGFCSGNGTLTITFSQPVSNPVLDVSGLGGWAWCIEDSPGDSDCNTLQGNGITMATNADGNRTAASWISQQFTIATPGVTFSAPSGQNLATTATTLTTASITSSHQCNTYHPTESETDPYTMTPTALAGCGSVTLNGTFQTVTFDIGTNIRRANAADGWANGYNVADTGTRMADLTRFSIRLPEDMGDAPASYDGTSAAAHIAGPLRLGSTFTVDAQNVTNPTTSPLASASASLDTDDAINDGVRAPDAVPGTTYSQTIPISGTVQPGTVAGWIDFNKNGLFDTGERVAATFAAGATSVVLTWTVPTTATAGDTYLRLRTSFTASEVSSPRGVARSGEVEDYIIGLAAPTPAITVVKLVNGQDANTAPGVSVPAGSTLTFEFQVQNTGNVRLTGVTLADNVIPGASIVPPAGWTGALNPGESVTFTATYPAPVTGGVLHTNTATVSGTPVTGGPAVTDTDPANATTQPQPAITVVKLVNGQDANTAPGVSVPAGSTLTFEFQVQNTGNVRLTGVTLADNVIPGASIVPPAGWTGALNPGESVTFTATYPAPTAGNALHTNTATVSGNPITGGPAVTDTDLANATTQPLATILIEKLGESTNGTWVAMDGSGFALRVDDAGSPGALLSSPTVQPVAGSPGQFQVVGLIAGTYWLEETVAPEGFALLAEPVRFSVTSSGTITILSADSPQVTAAANKISVRDVPAFTLPTAGGPGSSGFTASGVVLLLAAAGITIIVRRRALRPPATV